MDRKMPTPWKPTKAQLLAAHTKRVPDLVAKDLIVLFAGINPGLYTAAIGRHFGRPGNRFWPASRLVVLRLGCSRHLKATGCSTLTTGSRMSSIGRRRGRMNSRTTNLRAGGKRLAAKVKRWRPTVVAFVGIGPYRIISGVKGARVGLQKDLFGGSYAWVLPNPSGLNASYQPAALAELFGELRQWATRQHRRDEKKRPNSPG